MNFSNLKQEAKAQLEGYWVHAALITFIVWLLTDAFTQQRTVDAAVNTGFHVSANFGSLLSLLLTGPLTLGAIYFYMKAEAKEEATVSILFEGFNDFGRTFIFHFVSTLFIVLWSLLFLIPGVIAALRYSMGYFIIAENPEMSAMEALSASSELMQGHKMDLFGLMLSFIGWFILSLFTFGIGFLFLKPYFSMTMLNFYRELSNPMNQFYVE